MKIYDPKIIRYKDKLAKKRRRVWLLKTLFFIGLVVALVGFILYLLFFSGFLEIKEISVKGVDRVNGDRFHNELNKRLDSRWLGLFEYQKNILIFNSDTFIAEMLTAFPEISRKVDERLRLQLETDGCSDIRIEPDTRYFREPFTDGEGNYYEGEWMLQRVAIGVATLGG